MFLIYSKLDWLSNYFIWDLYMWLKEWYLFTAVTIICIWLTRLILLYDIKTYELHITATVFLAVITLFFTLTFWINRLEILLWIWIFTLIFWLIYYGSKLYVKEKYKKDAEWFGLWDVIIAPILGAWLVFFKQPNWIFERCYLVCLFIILSSLVWLVYYLIENLVKYFIVKKSKKSKKPYGFQTSIPFLPSMIIWFVLEVVFRESFMSLLII